MKKVKVIYWVRGTGLSTVNGDAEIELTEAEYNSDIYEHIAFRRFATFATANGISWKEVTNIIKL